MWNKLPLHGAFSVDAEHYKFLFTYACSFVLMCNSCWTKFILSMSLSGPTQYVDASFVTIEIVLCRSGLTMLVVDAKLSPTQQLISLRIQRPRVVVAFDFLLAVGEFFVPSMHAMLAEKGEENPLDMKKGIFLNNRVYKQTLKEIRISPKKPLVADYEGVQEYIYDGQGNTLRLLNRHNEDLSMFSPEVLIFVGDGKRLIFRNVVIQVFS